MGAFFFCFFCYVSLLMMTTIASPSAPTPPLSLSLVETCRPPSLVMPFKWLRSALLTSVDPSLPIPFPTKQLLSTLSTPLCQPLSVPMPFPTKRLPSTLCRPMLPFPCQPLSVPMPFLTKRIPSTLSVAPVPSRFHPGCHPWLKDRTTFPPFSDYQELFSSPLSPSAFSNYTIYHILSHGTSRIVASPGLAQTRLHPYRF